MAIALEPRTTARPQVEFLWLELTNRCNLRCVHCYAESGPQGNQTDRLTDVDYRRLIDEARDLGCLDVQFIGGEPTLNRDLPELISHARQAGYSFVEVFTNLTYLPDPLLRCLCDQDVSVATSFYSHEPEVHDEVTGVRGSFDRTVRNIGKVLAAKLPLRAGIIEMSQNQGHTRKTIAFLQTLGVERVGVDRLRKFGRADGCDESAAMTELCGSCAGKTLCVGPDGAVAPCIMSKAWSVGSVLDTSLAELSRSSELDSVRASIYREVVAPRMGRQMTRSEALTNEGGAIVNCGPCEPACNPCNPLCSPGQQCNPCNPSGGQPCVPNGRTCYPR